MWSYGCVKAEDTKSIRLLVIASRSQKARNSSRNSSSLGFVKSPRPAAL